MAVHDEKPQATQSDLYAVYEKTKGWVMSTLTLLLTILAVITVFLISSVQGTKEIKASNTDGVRILELWRIENQDPTGYPKEKEELFSFRGQEYYFVISKIDTEKGTIDKWYFAYEGGFGYVWRDWKYWILSGVALMITMIVVALNYKSAKEKEKEKENFKSSRLYFQRQKNKVRDIIQFISDYCVFVTNRAIENKRIEIVESAGIRYKDYQNGLKGLTLEKWQMKKLKKMRKINVTPLTSADLLHDNIPEGLFRKRKITMLPTSESEHQTRFLIRTFHNRAISILLSGFVIGFSFVLGEWGLGATYGFMVLSAAATATVAGKEYVNNTLKSRFIAKGDYLQEFFNMRDKFADYKEDDGGPNESKNDINY